MYSKTGLYVIAALLRAPEKSTTNSSVLTQEQITATIKILMNETADNLPAPLREDAPRNE